MTELSPELIQLHKRLQNHINEQKSNWKSFVYAQKMGFYQGFEEISLPGCRPTEQRLERYGISKYLTKEKTALDIGCNCGFFVLHISKFLKYVNGVEINPFLVNVGNDTKDFLKIGNVDFYATRFEDFIPEKKYDMIFSLANDDTIDGNTEFTFEEYVGKIQILLNKGGHLMWETISPDTYDPELFKPKRTILEKRFTLLEEKMVKSEYPVNVPERRFIVFQNN
jgi:2-polyprenyl-3-methyl-5-hydroxy-6-metoxy-1,4-benzoquinol methylase